MMSLTSMVNSFFLCTPFLYGVFSRGFKRGRIFLIERAPVPRPPWPLRVDAYASLGCAGSRAFFLRISRAIVSTLITIS